MSDPRTHIIIQFRSENVQVRAKLVRSDDGVYGQYTSRSFEPVAAESWRFAVERGL